MWRFKIFSVIYFLAVCADQDNDISKPSLQSPWLDVFPSEKVELSCSVSDSSDRIFSWHRNGHLLKSSTGSVLTITAESESQAYSVSYTCEVSTNETSDTLELKVHANKPTPTMVLTSKFDTVFNGESVTFECNVNVSSGWEYVWYHNRKEITVQSNNNTYTIVSINLSMNGQYQCQAKRGKDPFFTEMSAPTTLHVSGNPPTPILNKDPGLNLMYAGETVTFTCKVSVSSGWTYVWYNDGNELTTTEEINRIRLDLSDRGNYSCKAIRGAITTDRSNVMPLNVLEIPVPVLRRGTRWSDMFPTENVKFSCKMQGSLSWTYTWYRGGQVIQPDNTVSFDRDTATLSISSASDSHAGQYTCKGFLSNRSVNSSFSSGLDLTVYDKKPSVTLTQDPEYKEMFIGEQVSFTCGIKVSSGWEYEWYRDSTLLTETSNKYFINSVGKTDSGSYTCKAKRGSDKFFHTDSSQAIHLQIEDKKPSVTLTQDPEYKVMFTGEQVSFTCGINVSSGWKYEWYRDSTSLTETSNKYLINSVGKTDSGSYTCKAKRGSGKFFHTDSSPFKDLEFKERPKAIILALTGWSEVFSTDSLVLKCQVEESQDAWNYTWFKAGEPIILQTSEKHTATPQNDPEQSAYTCRGIRTGRPSYSEESSSFTTKNLLLKRRLLLSISGCLFFGIIAVFIGCIVLRVIRKPVDDYEKPEEAELFLTMAQLKDRSDTPSPLVAYITDENLKAPSQAGDENDTTCNESAPITSEDQAVTTESVDKEENNAAMVSFKQ